MEIKKVDISLVDNWDKNPRGIKEKDFNRLKQQIKNLGVYKALVACKENDRYIVLGGNMRLRAYKELGHKEVFIAEVEAKTDKRKTEIALSDNDSVGYYEYDKLYELLEPLKDDFNFEDFKVDIEGLKNISLESVFNDIQTKEVEGEDDVPETKKTNIKLGDMFELGTHRLLCGDSTKKADVERLMQGEKADIVFTDPPYSVNYTKKAKEVLKSKNYVEIKNDDMDINDISDNLWKPVFKNMYDVANDDCSVYSTMPQGGDQMMMMMMMSENWQVKHELIWVKEAPVFSMGRLDYDYKHEPILYGWKKKHNFYGQGEHTKSVWEISRTENTLHPTMKPVALVENALLNSSKKGDICFDPFGGSGSTLIACEKVNRKCRMLELDEHYCQVIIDRWQAFTGKKAKQIDS